MTTKLDSSKFTKDQLDTIINAFSDVADIIDVHNFAADTGLGDPKAKDRFIAALKLVYPNTFFKD